MTDPQQQAMPPLPGQRARFEAWFSESRKSRGRGKRPAFDLLGDGTYADDHTQRHWWTWQSALAASAPSREAVAWRWVPSEVWRDWVVTLDPKQAQQAREHGCLVEALGVIGEAPSRDAPEWISVDDRMPPDGDEVLVCVNYDDGSAPYVMVDRWVMNREDPLGMGGRTIETGFDWDNNDPLDVTHWMPLPAAPSVEGGKEGDDHA